MASNVLRLCFVIRTIKKSTIKEQHDTNSQNSELNLYSNLKSRWIDSVIALKVTIDTL